MLTVWAAWLACAQALLWTPLLRSIINAEAPAVRVDYRFAWSLWPGVVHARGLVITSQDRAVQWRLGIDRVSTRIALGQLRSRIFHASQVRASGVVFALRRRIARRELTPRRTVGLPGIPGFPAPPLKEEGPEDDLPDFRYRLYSAWLEDIEADEVRQIWIDQFRFEGAARVAGAFYLKPLRRVLIAPAELRISRGEVLRGKTRVADELEGSLRMRLGEVDPRGPGLQRLAERLDLDTDLRGRLRALPFVRGSGEGRVAVHVEAGKVRRGSLVDLKLAQTGAGPARAGAVEIHAQVDEGLRAVARASRLRLPGAAVESGRIEISGVAPDLADLRPPARSSIDVRGGRIEDARELQRLFTDGERIEAGQGFFSAHLEGPLPELSGWARVRLSRVLVRARGLRMQGDARIDAVVKRLDAESANLAGTRIAIRNGRLFGEDIAPAWWGRALLRKGTLRFEGPRVQADFAVRCRDARPIVGLFADVADLPGIVKGLFSMEGLSAAGSAVLAPDFLSLRELVARGEGASVEATVLQDASGQRGAALLKVRGISVALDLDGGASLHPFGPGDFYTERKKELAPPSPPSARRGPRRR